MSTSGFVTLGGQVFANGAEAAKYALSLLKPEAVVELSEPLGTVVSPINAGSPTTGASVAIPEAVGTLCRAQESQEPLHVEFEDEYPAKGEVHGYLEFENEQPVVEESSSSSMDTEDGAQIRVTPDPAAERLRLDIDRLRCAPNEVDAAIQWRCRFSSGRFDASQLTPRIGSGQAATLLNRAPSDGFADDHVGGAAVLAPLPSTMRSASVPRDSLGVGEARDVDVAIRWRRRVSAGADAAELVLSPRSQTSPLNRSNQATPLNRAPSDGFADDHVGGAAVLSPLPMQPAQVKDHLATSTGLEVAEEESPVPNQCVPNVYSQPFAGSNFFGGLAIRPSRTLEKRMSLVMLPTTPTSPDRGPAASEIAWS